jgi:hypothetical protein
MKIALWVARRHRPFAIVEDDELIEIFMDLNNKVEVPSRFTVSRDVKEIFELSRKRVAEILKVRAIISSRFSSEDICLGIPGKTTPLRRWLDFA